MAIGITSNWDMRTINLSQPHFGLDWRVNRLAMTCLNKDLDTGIGIYAEFKVNKKSRIREER